MHAGDVTGNCVSYTQDGRCVNFTLNDGSAIQLRLCSPSVIRIWNSPDGKFERGNASFAVVNEDLQDIGDLIVNEQNACYEIFTEKLRIRVNKAPFSLQIFDKYQKLLFSDHADKGHVSEGKRKVEYKTLRRDEHFFGLGEKTGKLASIITVSEDDDIMLITNEGTIIRTSVSGVNVYSRTATGVIIMRLEEGSRINNVARLEKSEEIEKDAEKVESENIETPAPATENKSEEEIDGEDVKEEGESEND